MGWTIRPLEKDGAKDADWWQSGGLPGSSAFVVRAANGLSWALLFNSRPKDPAFEAEVEKTLSDTAGEVKEWQNWNLFEKFEPQPAQEQ